MFWYVNNISNYGLAHLIKFKYIRHRNAQQRHQYIIQAYLIPGGALSLHLSYYEYMWNVTYKTYHILVILFPNTNTNE